MQPANVNTKSELHTHRLPATRPGDVDLSTRRGQSTALQNSFEKTLQVYHEVEKKIQNKYSLRMERQIRIGPFPVLALSRGL